MKNLTIVIICLSALFAGCRKDSGDELRYYEIGLSNGGGDWRDSTFVVATANAQLINEVNAQLQLPISERKIIIGSLVRGNGGYNKHGNHAFGWRMKEDDWSLSELSIEIYDGRPYNDVDLNISYWLDTVKRFSPWLSYIKREVKK
jgi:hypothetical protein